MSEQPGHGIPGSPGTPPSPPGHGYSAIPPRQRAGGDVGDGSASGNGERVSDLAKFDWFAELDNFGRVVRPAANQAGDLVPASDEGSDAGKRRWLRRRPSRQWGQKQRQVGRRGGDEHPDGWLAGRRKETGLSRLLRGWRLALGAIGLAIA